MAADLQIRLLGGLEIRLHDAPLTAFISTKAPALLAYLGVVGRPVQRDLLATLFWGELGDADAKNNLRQALTSLRRPLEPYLDINRATVALRDGPNVWLDVAAFTRSLRSASHAPPEERRAHLAAATALYHGDLLEGVLLRDAPDFEDWVTVQRTRLRELALNALYDLVELELAEGQFAAAIDSATRLLALDPWREEAHRQLMLALARTGQRSAALSQYEQCRRTMRAVFGVEPADTTAELAEQIKLALRGPRHNLLAPVNAFVGRGDELRALHHLLAAPGARLITLTGPGGIGKTRLAQQAAAEHIDYYLGGVWYVTLTPLDDAADITPAIIAALRILPAGAESPLQTLVNYLRQREALLILDDFEHVLTSANLAAVARLLAETQRLRILVTSRTRLQLQSEQVVAIDGLPYPAAVADSATAAKFAAVELFVRRARQQDATFALTAATAPLVAQISQAVDGMPLALELAAAWTPTLTLGEILSEITRGSDILTSTMHDAPQRHRSLRAVCASSWRMLSPAEQAVYAGAAIFRGGSAAAAAQAVVDATPQTLARLMNASLLRRTDDGRYRRHPLLLQFAVEQLQSQPDRYAAIARRHIAYFAALLHGQTAALYGAGQPDALNAVRQELDNIRQAWQLATAATDFAFFDQTVDALLLIFDIAGLIHLARDLCVTASATLTAAAHTPWERTVAARVQAMAGAFEFRVGAFAQARDLTATALAALRSEEAAPWCLGHAHIFLGGAYFGLGDLAQTLVEFHRALEAYTAAGSAWGRATALGNIAEMHMIGGDEAAALDFATRAQAIAEPTGNAYLLTHNTYRLAVLLAGAGDYSAAQRYQRASLHYAEQLSYTSGVGMATASLGDIAFATGDYAASAREFAEAVELHRATGNWMDEARCLVRQAEATLALGEVESCRSLLHAALRKALHADAAAVQMDALLLTARLWLAQGRDDEAAALLHHVAGAAAGAPATRTAAAELLAARPQRGRAPAPFSLAAVLEQL